MFRSFAAFLIGNRRALLFGVACAFLSSPGQTHFIAQFTPAFGRELDLSATALGFLYLGATLGAATLLPILHLPAVSPRSLRARRHCSSRSSSCV